jgi:hypothetical protein
MAGHSRPKDGVASLAYDPAMMRCCKRSQYLLCAFRVIMDARVKPGHDPSLIQCCWKKL